jgi:hypothetical protein
MMYVFVQKTCSSFGSRSLCAFCCNLGLATLRVNEKASRFVLHVMMMHSAGPPGAAQAAPADNAAASAINTAGMSATSAAAVAAASGLPNLARLAEPPTHPPHIGEAIVYHTQGTHHKGVFRWVIDNYSHLPQKPKKRTFTKEFQLCGHKWQLSVTPGGEKSDSTEAFMSVYLWYHGLEEIETAATIQLIDLNEHDRCVFYRHVPICARCC